MCACGTMTFQMATIAVMFSVTIMNLLFICGHMYANENTVKFFGPSYAYKAHDYPMTLPSSTSDLSAVFLPVEESVHYSLLGDASHDAWYALTNWTNGFVLLGPEERLFAVTMFHEMHCLRMLNLAYGGSKEASEGHISHCLDYLRQMVLCSADVTLEPRDFTERDFEMERRGSTHSCKDWTSIYDTMQRLSAG